MYLHGLLKRNDNSRQNHQHSGKNSIICAADLNRANDFAYLPSLTISTVFAYFLAYHP